LPRRDHLRPPALRVVIAFLKGNGALNRIYDAPELGKDAVTTWRSPNHQS
jgi:hypothetical protein